MKFVHFLSDWLYQINFHKGMILYLCLSPNQEIKQTSGRAIDIWAPQNKNVVIRLADYFQASTHAEKQDVLSHLSAHLWKNIEHFCMANFSHSLTTSPNSTVSNNLLETRFDRLGTSQDPC